jgi:hypothetical protein
MVTVLLFACGHCGEEHALVANGELIPTSQITQVHHTCSGPRLITVNVRDYFRVKVNGTVVSVYDVHSAPNGCPYCSNHSPRCVAELDGRYVK